MSLTGIRDFGWWQNTNDSVPSQDVWKEFHHSLEVRAYWKIRRYGFSFSASELAEMKIIFLFALGAGRELIPLQCFGCCWAALAQPQCCLQHSHLTSSLRVGNILGGDTTKPAYPKWRKGYSIPSYESCIPKRKRMGKGRH